MERVDVTVIGGGPVGLFAAFYAGMRDMSVRIIDSLPELGGQLNALYPEKYIYDMPGFPEILARDLATEMIKQGTRFSPEVVLDSAADRLERDDDGWTLITPSGVRMPTRGVILSTGAGAFSPTPLGVEGEERFVGLGLRYGVKSKEEYRGKTVLIVGGGDSAFDWALNLEPVAKRVVVAHRTDRFRAHEETVAAVQKLGVEVLTWSVVETLHGAEQLRAVTLLNTKTDERTEVEIDNLSVNIGFKTSLGALSEWGLELAGRQIKVDHVYETNLPDVFAVGDVCAFKGKIKLIATGVGEAATAVCVLKTRFDPKARLFPGHSSDMDLGMK